MQKYLQEEGLLPTPAESEPKVEEDTTVVPPAEPPMQVTWSRRMARGTQGYSLG